MTTFRSVLLAAVCLAVLLAPFSVAQAQTLSISTYTGNGQMICSGCTNWPLYLQLFQPLVAKVVDANGNPPALNTEVDWSVLGQGNLQNFQTFTDANGLTTNGYFVSPVQGSPSTPFFQSKVFAYAGSSSTVFYLTQALANAGTQGGANLVQDYFTAVPSSISGAAGSSGSPITAQVGSTSGFVPNVELQLVSFQASPSVSCAPPASGSNIGDPGTILTDSNGIATCVPVLAGSGSGRFFALLGGVVNNSGAPALPGVGNPAGFDSTYTISLTVAAPQPGSIQSVGGNNQSATAGQALPTALTALVKDTNGNAIAAQTVNWTCRPAGAGTFNRTSTVSDNNGQVQNTFVFASNANGVVTITASIAGTNFSTTFSETAVQLLTLQYFQKVSGDSPVQQVASGQPFPNPLVVQADYSNGQPASGVVVSFSLSGPATFTTSSTPATDSTGRASVSLSALTTSAQAQVTVTATLSNLTPITFQLSVIPQGPTNLVFTNTADQKGGSVSPCSLATLTGTGLAPNVQGTILAVPFGPAPLILQGDSITFVAGGNTIQAPIFSISNSNGTQSLNFQVPCEVPPGVVATVTVGVGGGSATVNLPVLAASPGVYSAPGTDGVTRAVLVRADGSFVNLANPARHGETVTAFVTGLGPTTPPVATNQVPPRGTVATVNGTVVPGLAGGGASLYALPQLTPDLVGVYQVSFTIPAPISSGNNVGFSIGLIPVGATTAQYSNLVYIPVGQ